MISKFTWAFILIGTIVMIVVMLITGKSLKTATTPGGIVSLELAGSAKSVNRILKAWNNDIPFTLSDRKGITAFRPAAAEEENNKSLIGDAKKNTYYDFMFIIFYTSLFYATCKTLASKLSNRKFWYAAGNFLAKATIVSALLDVVENVGMLQSLFGNVSNKIAAVTSIASITKWAIVCITIVYIVIAFLYWKIFYKKRSSLA